LACTTKSEPGSRPLKPTKGPKEEMLIKGKSVWRCSEALTTSSKGSLGVVYTLSGPSVF